MKRLLLLLLLCPAFALAQNPQQLAQATQNVGGFVKVVPSASVEVCVFNAGLQCNAPVKIFQDANLTVPQSNPLTADANGVYSYFIAAGNYIEQISSGGIVISTNEVSFTGGPSQSGIQSINGSTVPAQFIVSGTGISVASTGGTTTITSTAPTGGNGLINAANYTGADMCAQINAAILANPGVPVTAYTFQGNQACASNPFANATGDVLLFLGNVTVQTSSPWVTSSSFAARIVGSTRNNLNLGAIAGTRIQAAAGFPSTCDSLATGCPILRLGDGTGPAFGHRIENVTIDCNGKSGCIGLYSTDIQEQSGAFHFQIVNFSNIGILIDGSSNVGAGPFWAQNYELFDGEVYGLNFGTSSTVAVKLIGGNNSAGGETAPRLVSHVTASGTSGHQILAAFQFEQFFGGSILADNAENATTGYQFGISKPMNATTASNLRCASVVTNCVWITANSPFTNDLTLEGIQNTPTVATNTIKDDMTGNNILGSTDPYVAMHVIGNGFPSGGFTFFSTASTFGGGILNSMNLNNNRDASQILIVNGGKTADQNKTLQFQDRGTNKWSVQSTTTDQFLVFDHTQNRARFWFNPSDGNTYWNSGSTGAVNMNMEASNGTGGLKLGNGSGTNVFAVDGSGNMQLAGTAALTGAVTASGAVTVTGLTTTNGGLTTGTSSATVNRINATAGTHYSGADSAIVPSAGWGTTPTVSAGGVDQGFRFGIKAGGTGITANPTIVITFKDGAWPTNPTYVCGRSDLSSPWNSPPFTWSENTTSLTITFNGTPSSGVFYTFYCVTVGAAP